MRYLISLGSNLGDRAANLRSALGALTLLPGATVRASSLHETGAMYVEDQPDFLNAVAEVTVDLEPIAMLDAILEIERQHGRVRTQRYGPRTVDLDIVGAEDLVVDGPRLTVPHPRMQERDFVLKPLVEVAPGWVHPVLGLDARTLLDRLNSPAEVA